MKQLTLAATRGFEKHSRATRKAEFLARMEGLMPWAEFCAVIEPHYPKEGHGRSPVGLERMLGMYPKAPKSCPNDCRRFSRMVKTIFSVLHGN